MVSGRTKTILLFCLKAAVSIGLIAWLLHSQLPNFGDIRDALMSANPAIVGLAFSLHIIGYILCSWRWQLLLKAQGAYVPMIPLALSYLVGIFFNSFLPGIMSGDMIRGTDASGHLGSLSTSFLVIFVERLTGMIALLLLAAAALPLVGEEAVGNTNILWILLTVAALIVFAVMILFNSRIRKITGFLLKFPGLKILGNIAEKIYQASEVFRGQKRVLLGCTLISVAFQINVILHYYLIGKALAIPVSWYDYFAIIPVATFVMMIPATINGIGLREEVFIYLFSNFGVSPAKAVSLAWIAFGMVLVQALIGGIVFALRKKVSGA